MTVMWSWEPAGSVKLVNGKLAFPKVPNTAGVYRFLLSDAVGTASQVYIGEADLLARRLQHYRTPGPSQQTNLRLNRIMVDTLKSGGRITVEITTDARAVIAMGDPSTKLDLRRKSARVLVERAAEVAARAAGAALLNR